MVLVKRVVLLSLSWVALSWCGAPAGVPDAGADAGTADAGSLDDAGLPGDAGLFDAGVVDAGADAGDVDGGEPPDAGEGDAGLSDAGDSDGGLDDAGTEDAGPPLLRDDAGCPVPTGTEPAFTFRAMAANLTSGNFQSYDPGHGQRIMQGSHPDVVMIQEFSYGLSSTQDLDDFVSITFDGSFSWHRGAGMLPNGVISRFPIVARGEWEDTLASNREFTWARLDLPGPADLWVISVHLLTANATTRNNEARQLVEYLNQHVPAGDYVLVGGDFNTDTLQEATYTTLAPRFVVTEPQPADHLGNGMTNANRTKAYDGLFASRCLAARQVATVLGASQFDAGAVIDTRIYTPLSEIAPALATDSSASGMQHMGVLKDFLIQP